MGSGRDRSLLTSSLKVTKIDNFVKDDDKYANFGEQYNLFIVTMEANLLVPKISIDNHYNADHYLMIWYLVDYCKGYTHVIISSNFNVSDLNKTFCL